MRVLLLDGDLDLGNAMRPTFERYAIKLYVTGCATEAITRIEGGRFDVVLMDIVLDGTNGLDVCRRIRRLDPPHNEMPIIFLTARNDLTDLVVGLETGADDYMFKPFEPRELVARLHAVLRRTRGDVRSSRPAAQSGHDVRSVALRLDECVLLIDAERAVVEINGARLNITSMEYELLRALADRPGEALTRDEALERIQGASRIYPRSVDALIYRLRAKMIEVDAKAQFIRTIRGQGYALIGQRAELESPTA